MACKKINLDLKQLPHLNKLRVHSLYLILVFNGKRTVKFAQSPIQTLCMNVLTLFIWAICVREYGVSVQRFTIQPATMCWVSAILIILTANRTIGFTRKCEKWKNHEIASLQLCAVSFEHSKLGFTQQGNGFLSLIKFLESWGKLKTVARAPFFTHRNVISI